jgi:hypothetical protein
VKHAIPGMHAGEIHRQRHQRARQFLVEPAVIEWHELAHASISPIPRRMPCKHNGMNEA